MRFYFNLFNMYTGDTRRDIYWPAIPGRSSSGTVGTSVYNAAVAVPGSRNY